MKILTMLYFVINIFICNQNVAIARDFGKVFLIPFEFELYVPASELTIESRAIEQWRITKSGFLMSVQGEWFEHNLFGYSKDNVRAMIVFENDLFFVDRYGRVRNGLRYSTLDIKIFRSNMEK